MITILSWVGLVFGSALAVWGLSTRHYPLMRMGIGGALSAVSRQVPGPEALRIGIGAVGLVLMLWAALHFSGILPSDSPSAAAGSKSS